MSDPVRMYSVLPDAEPKTLFGLKNILYLCNFDPNLVLTSKTLMLWLHRTGIIPERILVWGFDPLLKVFDFCISD